MCGFPYCIRLQNIRGLPLEVLQSFNIGSGAGFSPNYVTMLDLDRDSVMVSRLHVTSIHAKSQVTTHVFCLTSSQR